MFGLTFEPKIDIGHFLTFLTLVAGFVWWLYTSVRSWQKKADDDAHSGVLRLLLKILRDHEGKAVSINTLFHEFHSSEMKRQRLAYSGRDYKFINMPKFEAALYQLDWEGKIDFPSPHEVVFRVDYNFIQQSQNKFFPNEQDSKRMLGVLKDALHDESVDSWRIAELAESCIRVAPNETAELLREGLHSPDTKTTQRVVQAISRVLPNNV